MATVKRTRPPAPPTAVSHTETVHLKPRPGARSREEHDADYTRFATGVQATFDRACAGSDALFHVSTKGLFDAYSDKLGGERGVHSCDTCRSFFKRFGGLVTIDGEGVACSAVWDPAAVPEFYVPAVAALRVAVNLRRVEGMFMREGATWGVPTAGGWDHLSLVVPTKMLFGHPVLTAAQGMAKRRSDVATVARALTTYKAPVIREALTLLETDALTRAPRFVDPARWLLNVQEERTAQRNSRQRDNLLQRAVVSAPEGFLHVKGTMLGQLLDDIGEGKPYEVVKARFNHLTASGTYMTPKALPTEGNRARAEQIVASIPGLDRSLVRRFARLDEVPLVWTPRPPPMHLTAQGVFGHLPVKSEPTTVQVLDIPAQVMTWVKFSTTVLERAAMLALWIGKDDGNLPMQAITTAEHADAPPILAWDRVDDRNPLSCYGYKEDPRAPFYPNKSVRVWGLVPHTWQRLAGIATRPNMISRPLPHYGEGVILLLAGAGDTSAGQGNGLFPETLRAELHEVRATVAAYSRAASLGDVPTDAACGVSLSPGSACKVVLRALVDGRDLTYQIDRWD